MRLLVPALLVLSTCTCLRVQAQAERGSARETFERRSRQQNLEGRYIPKDLPDALEALEGLTSASSRKAYAGASEEEVVHQLYFSFGRWMAINWGFYDGSRFSAYLRNLGVDRPDGQIEFMMRAYHRHLNGQDLDVAGLASAYKAKRAASDSLKLANSTVSETTTRTLERPAGDSLRRD